MADNKRIVEEEYYSEGNIHVNHRKKKRRECITLAEIQVETYFFLNFWKCNYRVLGLTKSRTGLWFNYNVT